MGRENRLSAAPRWSSSARSAASVAAPTKNRACPTPVTIRSPRIIQYSEARPVTAVGIAVVRSPATTSGRRPWASPQQPASGRMPRAPMAKMPTARPTARSPSPRSSLMNRGSVGMAIPTPRNSSSAARQSTGKVARRTSTGLAVLLTTSGASRGCDAAGRVGARAPTGRLRIHTIHLSVSVGTRLHHGLCVCTGSSTGGRRVPAHRIGQGPEVPAQGGPLVTPTPQTADVVAAESVGVDPHRLDVLLRRARLEVERGPLPSAHLAVARAGRLVAFETWGDPEVEAEVPRYVLQSV